MKKKRYVQPASEVVELRVTEHLLQASIEASRNGYESTEVEEW